MEIEKQRGISVASSVMQMAHRDHVVNLLVDSTPIDYLDFASPVSGLGSKMGLDATHKWLGETNRGWGRTM